MEIVIIFFGVIVITAVLFGFWLIISLIRLVLRGIFALAGSTTLPRPTPLTKTGFGVRCGNNRCRHANSAAAQFCTRCGTAIAATPRASVRTMSRTAAMW